MRDGHLEETLRRILAETLVNEANNPILSRVTINEVRLNRDRTVAEVYYTDMEEGGLHREAQNALRRARGFLQRVIGEQLRLRNVPLLRFRYDESLDRSFRVEELLEDLGGPTARSQDDGHSEDED